MDIRRVGARGRVLLARLETPAFVTRLDDLAVMCQAVEQGRSHLGIAEVAREGGPVGRVPAFEVVRCAHRADLFLEERLGDKVRFRLVAHDDASKGSVLGRRLRSRATIWRSISGYARRNRPIRGTMKRFA